jgi:hypothetical protein
MTVSSPEFVRIQQDRKHAGLEPMPTDEELDATLQAAGFTECLGVAYKFGAIEKPAVAVSFGALKVTRVPRPPHRRGPDRTERNEKIRALYSRGVARGELVERFTLSRGMINKITIGIRRKAIA